ncbi:hypothetical protein PAMP_019413 [Pampus punctatissimus]
MAGCASIRQTDTPTDKEQTCRQEDAATVDFGLCFLPIQSYKENDIIPVLIGQQEEEDTASGHSSWLQEDKRSSTESVHRSAAPSCLAAAPLPRSTTAATDLSTTTTIVLENDSNSSKEESIEMDQFGLLLNRNIEVNFPKKLQLT